MCDAYGCTKAYHHDCAGVNAAELRESDDWHCPACVAVEHIVAVSSCPTGSNYARRVALKHQTAEMESDTGTAQNASAGKITADHVDAVKNALLPAAPHAPVSSGAPASPSATTHYAAPLERRCVVLCGFHHAELPCPCISSASTACL